MMTTYRHGDTIQCFIFPNMPIWWMYVPYNREWYWLPGNCKVWQLFDKNDIPVSWGDFEPSLDKAIVRMVNRVPRLIPGD